MLKQLRNPGLDNFFTLIQGLKEERNENRLLASPPMYCGVAAATVVLLFVQCYYVFGLLYQSNIIKYFEGARKRLYRKRID